MRDQSIVASLTMRKKLVLLLALLTLSAGGGTSLRASSPLKQGLGARLVSPFKKTIATVVLSLTLATGAYRVTTTEEQAVAVKIIAPGFVVPPRKLRYRIEQLRQQGFDASFAYPEDRSVAERAAALVAALSDPSCENLVCARGGFGTSDLLPHIPYEDLTVHKRVIGYSDISSLLSALWTKKQFVGISGPMPWAVTWRSGTEEMRVLLGIMRGEITTGSIPVRLQKKPDIVVIEEEESITGTLYGGDMSVLTNLIGTPYMPESLQGYLLFFEGLSENTFRVIRYLNQWQQSGMLDDVQAIVLGRFDKLDGKMSDLYAKFAARVSCPVYTTSAFGHLRPLYPLPVGGQGRIADGKLIWELPTHERTDD